MVGFALTSRTRPGSHARERFAENGRVRSSGSHRGQSAGVAAELKHGHLLRIAAELFDGELGGIVRGRPEAADRQLFAVEVGGGFDFRTYDEFEGKKINPAGDDRAIAALKIRGHRESAEAAI